MYVCVLIIVSGQALLFGPAWLFAYAGVLLVAFHLFVQFYEEPSKIRRVVRDLFPARGSIVATSDAVARVRYVRLLTTR